MRNETDSDWAEKRQKGRRDDDRGVCIWHDMCHETVADIKQETISMKELLDSKLPSWIFKLFLGTLIPLVISLFGLLAWMGLNEIETQKAITKNGTNLTHLMHEFEIKPIE